MVAAEPIVPSCGARSRMVPAREVIFSPTVERASSVLWVAVEAASLARWATLDAVSWAFWAIPEAVSWTLPLASAAAWPMVPVDCPWSLMLPGVLLGPAITFSLVGGGLLKAPDRFDPVGRGQKGL